ncbi:MAG: TIGR03936 family radical SAM-associated protein [Acutalibacteraceae bacterium]
MKPVRIWFEKHEDAQYISHLDLNRYMPRAIRRSKIPVWHTEGFNKHIYVNFALPLSMGYESRRDCFEIRIDENKISVGEVFERLKDSMPTGIIITDITEPVMSFKQICYANYTITLNIGGDKIGFVKSVLTRPEIPVIKKSKSAEKEINLSDFMKNAEIKVCGDNITVNADMPAGCRTNINPSMIIQALNNCSEDCTVCIKTVRNGFKTENFEDFR